MDDRAHHPSAIAPPGRTSAETARGDARATPETTYEERLQRDPRWALSEGSRHFEENSAVFQALHAIAHRLKTLNIPYAVVGGMALFRHGVRRFTEDVDLLVTPADLKTIHDKLGGLGYLPPFPRSKHLRDTQRGVKIEFLTTGGYPGDGKAKPVSFPDPRDVSFESDGIAYITLPRLIELKLASGMTNPGRLKDLSDVLELIKTLDLPTDFARQLNPFVQGKYEELWKQARTRYVKPWRNHWLASEARTIEEIILQLRSTADQLEAMRRDGVTLDEESGRLVTTDPKVAEKHGLIDESEFWDHDVSQETAHDE